MFQFPGLAAARLCIHRRLAGSPCAGCPIRRSPDQSLLAAPRSFSQLSTSFIASRSPRHPPCALCSLTLSLRHASSWRPESDRRTRSSSSSVSAVRCDARAPLLCDSDLDRHCARVSSTAYASRAIRTHRPSDCQRSWTLTSLLRCSDVREPSRLWPRDGAASGRSSTGELGRSGRGSASRVVELIGIEPTTSGLQSPRSPS